MFKIKYLITLKLSLFFIALLGLSLLKAQNYDEFKDKVLNSGPEEQIALINGQNELGKPRILEAIFNGDDSFVHHMLTTDPGLVSLYHNEITPLDVAVSTNNAPIVELLIKHGAKPIDEKHYRELLHEAMVDGQPEIFELLLYNLSRYLNDNILDELFETTASLDPAAQENFRAILHTMRQLRYHADMVYQELVPLYLQDEPAANVFVPETPEPQGLPDAGEPAANVFVPETPEPQEEQQQHDPQQRIPETPPLAAVAIVRAPPAPPMLNLQQAAPTRSGKRSATTPAKRTRKKVAPTARGQLSIPEAFRRQPPATPQPQPVVGPVISQQPPPAQQQPPPARAADASNAPIRFGRPQAPRTEEEKQEGIYRWLHYPPTSK